MSASLIPAYSKLLAQGRDREAGRLAGAVAGLLTFITGTFVLLMVVFARPLTALLAPGLDERTFELAVTLTRIVTPGIGLLILSAWCLGVLNSHRRFFLPYVAPVLMNIAQIGLLVAGARAVAGNLSGNLDAFDQSDLVMWLAWATVVGGFLQFAVQLPTVLRTAPSLRFDVRAIREATPVVRSFVPVALQRGVVHVSGYLHLVLASFLAVGALAATRYAQMLVMLPISLFAMAVSAAQLPEMSASADDDPSDVRARLDAGLTRIVFLVAPVAAAYVTVGDLLVAAVFRSGQFDSTDVTLVWLVLAASAGGLLATSASRLLQSVLYALGDTRLPSRIAILRVAVSVVIGLVLMLQFDRFTVGPNGLDQVGDLPAFGALPGHLRDQSLTTVRNLGAVGLAVAGVAAALLEYSLLRRAVRRRVGGAVSMVRGRDHRTLLGAALASAVIGIAARPADRLQPIIGGVLAITLVGAAYFAFTWLLQVPETRRLVSRLRSLLQRR